MEKLSRDVLRGEHELSTALLACANRSSGVVPPVRYDLLLQFDFPQVRSLRKEGPDTGTSYFGILQEESGKVFIRSAGSIHSVTNTIHNASFHTI